VKKRLIICCFFFVFHLVTLRTLLGVMFRFLGPDIAAIPALILGFPLVSSIMIFDFDGDVLPKWFQAASWPLNSLICAVGLYAILTWLARRKERKQDRSVTYQ